VIASHGRIVVEAVVEAQVKKKEGKDDAADRRRRNIDLIPEKKNQVVMVAVVVVVLAAVIDTKNAHIKERNIVQAKILITVRVAVLVMGTKNVGVGK